MNGTIKLYFGNCTTSDKTLRLYNITSEVALCYCNKIWIINNRKYPKHESNKNEIFKTTTGT
jgi:hypothetical protein